MEKQEKLLMDEFTIDTDEGQKIQFKFSGELKKVFALIGDKELQGPDWPGNFSLIDTIQQFNQYFSDLKKIQLTLLPDNEPKLVSSSQFNIFHDKLMTLETIQQDLDQPPIGVLEEIEYQCSLGQKYLDRNKIIEGKSIESDKICSVIVFGITGAGKSSLINHLIGNKLYSIEEKLSWVLEVEGNVGAKIGHDSNSETTLPKKYLGKNNIYYWDFPGLMDNKGAAQEVANAYYMRKIFETSDKVQILLVIPEEDFKDTKHIKIALFFETIRRIFQQEVDKIINGIMFCISKASEEFPLNKINESLFKSNQSIMQHGQEFIKCLVPEKIIVFHKPNKNIVKLIPFEEMANQIEKQSTYLEKPKIQIALSSEKQRVVQSIICYLNQEVKYCINQLSQYLIPRNNSNYDIEKEVRFFQDLVKLKISLITLLENTKKKNNPHNFIQEIRNLLIMNGTINDNYYIQVLVKQMEILIFLQSVELKAANHIDPQQWQQCFSDFLNTVVNQQKCVKGYIYESLNKKQQLQQIKLLPKKIYQKYIEKAILLSINQYIKVQEFKSMYSMFILSNNQKGLEKYKINLQQLIGFLQKFQQMEEIDEAIKTLYIESIFLLEEENPISQFFTPFKEQLDFLLKGDIQSDFQKMQKEIYQNNEKNLQNFLEELAKILSEKNHRELNKELDKMKKDIFDIGEFFQILKDISKQFGIKFQNFNNLENEITIYCSLKEIDGNQDFQQDVKLLQFNFNNIRGDQKKEYATIQEAIQKSISNGIINIFESMKKYISASFTNEDILDQQQYLASLNGLCNFSERNSINQIFYIILRDEHLMKALTILKQDLQNILSTLNQWFDEEEINSQFPFDKNIQISKLIQQLKQVGKLIKKQDIIKKIFQDVAEEFYVKSNGNLEIQKELNDISNKNFSDVPNLNNYLSQLATKFDIKLCNLNLLINEITTFNLLKTIDNTIEFPVNTEIVKEIFKDVEKKDNQKYEKSKNELKEIQSMQIKGIVKTIFQSLDSNYFNQNNLQQEKFFNSIDKIQKKIIEGDLIHYILGEILIDDKLKLLLNQQDTEKCQKINEVFSNWKFNTEEIKSCYNIDNLCNDIAEFEKQDLTQKQLKIESLIDRFQTNLKENLKVMKNQEKIKDIKYVERLQKDFSQSCKQFQMLFKNTISSTVGNLFSLLKQGILHIPELTSCCESLKVEPFYSQLKLEHEFLNHNIIIPIIHEIILENKKYFDDLFESKCQWEQKLSQIYNEFETINFAKSSTFSSLMRVNNHAQFFQKFNQQFSQFDIEDKHKDKKNWGDIKNLYNITLNEDFTAEYQDQILKIQGILVRLSKIQEQINSNSQEILAIQVFARKIVFDSDLQSRGINLYIIAQNWYGSKVNVDLSGEKGKEYDNPSLANGYEKEDIEDGQPGSNGQNGKHGLPGSNAGSFYGVGLKFIDIKSTVIFNINDGLGGNGQNGQDGSPGQDGMDASICKYRSITSTLKAYKQSHNVQRKFTQPSVFHTDAAFYGYWGGIGGNSGAGGFGGLPGNPGQVKLFKNSDESTDIFQISKQFQNQVMVGQQGKNGKVGDGGNHGWSIIRVCELKCGFGDPHDMYPLSQNIQEYEYNSENQCIKIDVKAQDSEGKELDNRQEFCGYKLDENIFCAKRIKYTDTKNEKFINLDNVIIFFGSVKNYNEQKTKIYVDRTRISTFANLQKYMIEDIYHPQEAARQRDEIIDDVLILLNERYNSEIKIIIKETLEQYPTNVSRYYCQKIIRTLQEMIKDEQILSKLRQIQNKIEQTIFFYNRASKGTEVLHDSVYFNKKDTSYFTQKVKNLLPTSITKKRYWLFDDKQDINQIIYQHISSILQHSQTDSNSLLNGIEYFMKNQKLEVPSNWQDIKLYISNLFQNLKPQIRERPDYQQNIMKFKDLVEKEYIQYMSQLFAINENEGLLVKSKQKELWFNIERNFKNIRVDNYIANPKDFQDPYINLYTIQLIDN